MTPRDRRILTDVRRTAQIAPLLLAAVAGLVVGTAERLQTPIPAWMPEVSHLTLLIVGLLALELFLEQVEIHHRLAKLEATETERQISGLDRRERMAVRAAVANYAKMCELKRRTRKKNPCFGKICDEILFEQTSGLQGLSQGRLYVPPGQLELVQKRLMEYYPHRFEAVSQNDLAFWLDSGSKHYDAVIRTAIRDRQTTVSRIFVLDRYQLLTYAERLAPVLREQFADGVAWGVAVMDEHIGDFGDLDRPLDFGIFDEGLAVRVFRGAQSLKLDGLFLTPNTRDEIKPYLDAFQRRVGACCFVNSAFAALYPRSLPAEAARIATARARQIGTRLGNLVGQATESNDSPYFLVADEHTKIRPYLLRLNDALNAAANPIVSFGIDLRNR